MTHLDLEYHRAASALDRLADEVETRAARFELTPANVAVQAGVPVTTVLALHDRRDIALRSASALLRWLGTPIPSAWDRPLSDPQSTAEQDAEIDRPVKSRAAEKGSIPRAPRPCPTCSRMGKCADCCCVSPDHTRRWPQRPTVCPLCKHETSTPPGKPT